MRIEKEVRKEEREGKRGNLGYAVMLPQFYCARGSGK